MTEKQKKLLEIVKTMKKHSTAEEIYLESLSRGFNVSFASVYRILNKLSQEGQLRRIQVMGEKDIYDTFVHDHEHLICSKCGKIMDIEIADFKNLLEKKTGMKIDSYDLVMRFVCKECSKK